MTADLALDRGAGPRLEPRLEDGPDRAAVRRGEVDDHLVLVDAADPFDRRSPQARARRHEAESMEVAAEADRGPVAQSAACLDLGPIARLGREVATEPRFALGQERVDVPLGIRQPRRPAAGTVTTTPRAGWMTTRRPRDRGERRSVYGNGPPGSLATAGVSVTAPPSMDAAAIRRSVTGDGAAVPVPSIRVPPRSTRSNAVMLRW